MSLFNIFRPKKEGAASVAKERLQMVIAHQRAANSGKTDFMADLQRDLLAVIAKYVNIDPDQITVNLDRSSNDTSILEVNVELPESPIGIGIR